jgi:hypothetical protein
MASCSESLVSLPGLIVPYVIWKLVSDLESRGVSVTATADGDVLVRPCRSLTDEERAILRRYKSHALAMCDYQPPRVA